MRRRPSSCCTKASDRLGCGEIFRTGCKPPPGPACWCIRAAAIAAPHRAGGRGSTRVELPRPLDYMHIEALDVLPKLLDKIGFRRGLLLGHSDGASIAAIYAGGVQDHRVRGVAMIAPHFVVGDISVTSIAALKHGYETGS